MDEIDRRSIKNKINEMEAMKKEKNPPPEKPWHHKQGDKSLKDINKMSENQKTKYIMEGRWST